jgi:hypothetical protein
MLIKNKKIDSTTNSSHFFKIGVFFAPGWWQDGDKHCMLSPLWSHNRGLAHDRKKRPKQIEGTREPHFGRLGITMYHIET